MSTGYLVNIVVIRAIQRLKGQKCTAKFILYDIINKSNIMARNAKQNKKQTNQEGKQRVQQKYCNHEYRV